ncbi:hypothetical protein XBI1_2740016 [Xenorhabdus bovienii str. Intermedium]|uniref:Uncharacterized protein n=1 Tax=Xenorhabdus bovienii str. Intermedium TaxID=1379677 RepID=A0A077QK93_XENBV|nr:hypothetical protein XBI1_2740016 [Xenorhabdus bovienii str. Intermedium]
MQRLRLTIPPPDYHRIRIAIQQAMTHQGTLELVRRLAVIRAFIE